MAELVLGLIESVSDIEFVVSCLIAFLDYCEPSFSICFWIFAIAVREILQTVLKPLYNVFQVRVLLTLWVYFTSAPWLMPHFKGASAYNSPHLFILIAVLMDTDAPLWLMLASLGFEISRSYR